MFKLYRKDEIWRSLVGNGWIWEIPDFNFVYPLPPKNQPSHAFLASQFSCSYPLSSLCNSTPRSICEPHHGGSSAHQHPPGAWWHFQVLWDVLTASVPVAAQFFSATRKQLHYPALQAWMGLWPLAVHLYHLHTGNSYYISVFWGADEEVFAGCTESEGNLCILISGNFLKKFSSMGKFSEAQTQQLAFHYYLYLSLPRFDC